MGGVGFLRWVGAAVTDAGRGRGRGTEGAQAERHFGGVRRWGERTLASVGIGGEILLWDVESVKTTGALEGHTTAAGSLQLDPSGGRLWSLGYDGRILVHSLGDRSVEREIEVAEERPFMMCLSSDGSRLGMTYSGGAAVYSTEPYERIGEATTKVKGMYGVAFSQTAVCWPPLQLMARLAFGALTVRNIRAGLANIRRVQPFSWVSARASKRTVGPLRRSF